MVEKIQMTEIDQMLLEEIRLVRKDTQEIHTEISKIKVDLATQKVKVAIITGAASLIVSALFNAIPILMK